MGVSPAFLVVEDDDRRPGLSRTGSVSPQVGLPRLAGAGIELADRCFIGMQAIALAQQLASRSASGCRATPMRPIRSASVERASGTPWRAAICSMRYSGK